jgi:hypothetical protein
MKLARVAAQPDRCVAAGGRVISRRDRRGPQSAQRWIACAARPWRLASSDWRNFEAEGRIHICFSEQSADLCDLCVR